MKSITLQIKVGLCRGSQSLVLASRLLLLEVCEPPLKSIVLIDDFVAGRYAVFGGGIVGSLWEYMSPCVCIYFVLLFLSSTLDVGNDVTPSTAVDIWDSVTNTWSLVNMSVARYHAAAAPFGDTSVLFIGVIETIYREAFLSFPLRISFQAVKLLEHTKSQHQWRCIISKLKRGHRCLT